MNSTADICTIYFHSNATDFHCITPSLRDMGRTNLLDQPLEANLTLEGDFIMPLNNTFTFKNDPVIDSINPLKTFLE